MAVRFMLLSESGMPPGWKESVRAAGLDIDERRTRFESVALYATRDDAGVLLEVSAERPSLTVLARPSLRQIEIVSILAEIGLGWFVDRRPGLAGESQRPTRVTPPSAPAA